MHNPPTMANLYLAQINDLVKEQQTLLRLLYRALDEGRDEAAAFLEEHIRDIANTVRTLHLEILFGCELTAPRTIGRVRQK